MRLLHFLMSRDHIVRVIKEDKDAKAHTDDRTRNGVHGSFRGIVQRIY